MRSSSALTGSHHRRDCLSTAVEIKPSRWRGTRQRVLEPEIYREQFLVDDGPGDGAAGGGRDDRRRGGRKAGAPGHVADAVDPTNAGPNEAVDLDKGLNERESKTARLFFAQSACRLCPRTPA